MENREFERHLRDDTVLNNISKMFISLQEKDIRTINTFLQPVIKTLIEHMKEENSLFRIMYKQIIYCGSFYKGTKIGEPNEFDLNIILEVPINYDCINIYPISSSYVKLSITDNIRAYNTAKIHNLTNKERRALDYFIFGGILDANNFRTWIKSIVDQVLNKLPGLGNERELSVNDSFKAKIKRSESGPAITLIIKIPHQIQCISVDLVPALSFNITKVTERLTTKFRILQERRNKECFAIPIPEFVESFHWRLSFCHQENEMLGKYGPVKPIIRLIKKLRDTQNWKKIASYYIETVCLNKLTECNMDINKTTKTLFLFTMLEELHYAFDQHKINYFWNEEHNLLCKIHNTEMFNIANHLKRIINDIKRNAEDDFILAKYILNPEELSSLRKKINEPSSMYQYNETYNNYIYNGVSEETNDAENTTNNNICIII